MYMRFVFGGGDGVIYAITDDGRMLFYKDEARNGNGVWAYGGIGKQIGQGWTNVQHVFSGGDGIIYAITNDGRILFYKDESRAGNGAWAFGGVGKQIGEGWTNFQHVFSGGNGVIYAIDGDGNMMFYKDESRAGNGVWAFGGVGQNVGVGWNNVRHVCSGGNGIIYAVDKEGNLLFYRDEAQNGTWGWAFNNQGQVIGRGWTGIRQLISDGDGILYVINSDGKLLFYRDEARNGTAQWSFGGVGKQIGEGWNVSQANFELTTKWGVYLSTFADAARGTQMTADWLTEAFDETDGVAAFFRQMSGGRQQMDFQIFGPKELMSIEAKKAADTNGTTIGSFRAAAASQGILVTDFDHWMWVIDDGISTLGTTPNDSLVGALDFAPQTAMHELTHTCGVCAHADRSEFDDYGDAFCVMGGSRYARGFFDQNLFLQTTGDLTNDYYSLSGPGICTPYLFLAGWLDEAANTTALPPTPDLTSRFTLDANQGAPPFGSNSIVALRLGATPQQVGDAPQLWLEYRHPSGYDAAINHPQPFYPQGLRTNRTLPPADLPEGGVLIVHSVQVLNFRCGSAWHSYLTGSVAATKGNIVQLTDQYWFRIENVNEAQKQVELALG